MLAEVIKSWRAERRQDYVTKRMALPPIVREPMDRSVTRHVETLLGRHSHAALGFCWPFKGEFDCRDIAARAISGGATAALPVVVERKKPLVFREWRPGMILAKDEHGIPVPGSEVATVEPDLVLLPMNGFDSQGFRLGYGGGYFDRTLAALEKRPLVIGLCYELGRLDTIFPQAHDIPVDYVVTEKATYLRGPQGLAEL